MSRQSRFDARYWMLGAGALGWPRGMVLGGRKEEGSGWGTRVYLWRIYVDKWQNQYNTVKLKIKKKIIPKNQKGWNTFKLILQGQHHPDTAAAKSLQLFPTLCNSIDDSPPGSPVPGILQARTLEWAAISFSNAWKWKVKVKLLSHVRLFVIPWTAAYQAPPPMRFFRQEYWSGVPLTILILKPHKKPTQRH